MATVIGSLVGSVAGSIVGSKVDSVKYAIPCAAAVSITGPATATANTTGSVSARAAGSGLNDRGIEPGCISGVALPRGSGRSEGATIEIQCRSSPARGFDPSELDENQMSPPSARPCTRTAAIRAAGSVHRRRLEKTSGITCSTSVFIILIGNPTMR